MTTSGQCLCGAVTYELAKRPEQVDVCHCKMCRRFSGGIYVAFAVPETGVTFQGEDQLARFTSSDWAERGFCKTCGSSLFYQVTADGPMKGDYHMTAGTLDDQAGIPLTTEIFIDKKPDGYSFAEETHKMTEEEVFAAFSPPEE